jgi:hypothetical protein
MAVFSVTQSALAADLKNYIYSAPVQKSLSCEKQVNGIAQRFAQQTGLKVTSQSCYAQSGELPQEFIDATQVAVIGYAAEEPARIYNSTYGDLEEFTYVGSPEGYVGIYPDYKSCAKDLQAMTELDLKETGRANIVSYCQPGSSSAYAMNPTYILKIDSGLPANRGLFAAVPFEGTASTQSLKLAQSLLQAQGVHILRQMNGVFFFYDDFQTPGGWGSVHANLYPQVLAAYASASDAGCAADAARLNAHSDPAQLIFACTEDKVSEGGRLELSSKPSEVSLTFDSQIYPSEDICRAQIASFDRAQQAKDPLFVGSLCSDEKMSGQFQLVSIERTK